MGRRVQDYVVGGDPHLAALLQKWSSGRLKGALLRRDARSVRGQLIYGELTRKELESGDA